MVLFAREIIQRQIRKSHSSNLISLLVDEMESNLLLASSNTSMLFSAVTLMH